MHMDNDPQKISKFNCPHCKKPFMAPSSDRSIVVICPNCGGKSSVGGTRSSSSMHKDPAVPTDSPSVSSTTAHSSAAEPELAQVPSPSPHEKMEQMENTEAIETEPVDEVRREAHGKRRSLIDRLMIIPHMETNIAELLLDNGYTTLSQLRNATLQDLERIPGVGFEQARDIISDIQSMEMTLFDPKRDIFSIIDERSQVVDTLADLSSQEIVRMKRNLDKWAVLRAEGLMSEITSQFDVVLEEYKGVMDAKTEEKLDREIEKIHQMARNELSSLQRKINLENSKVQEAMMQELVEETKKSLREIKVRLEMEVKKRVVEEVNRRYPHINSTSLADALELEDFSKRVHHG